MNLSGLLHLLRHQESYEALLAQLASGVSLGLIRSARPFVVAALAEDTARPVLVITSRIDLAHNLGEQIRAWSPGLPVLTYAEPNPIFYERAPWGPRSTRARLQVLAALSHYGEPTGSGALVVVTSARALMQRTLPLDDFSAHQITLRRSALAPGGSPEGLLHHWLAMGYEPVSLVTEPGTYSRRGGILDIFPVALQHPVRVEFWGDEVESLRSFDPATQRSAGSLAEVTITPAREALPGHGPQVAALLDPWFAQFAGDEGTASPHVDRHPLEQGTPFPVLEFYLPWMHERSSSLLEYLPDSTLVLVDDLPELSDTVADLEQQALSLRESHLEAGDIQPDMPLPYVTWEQIDDELAQAQALQLAGTPEDSTPVGDLFSPGQRFGGQIRMLLDHLRDLQLRQARVIVISRQAERLTGLWREHTIGPSSTSSDTLLEPPPPGQLAFVQGVLAEGWALQGGDSPTHLLTDAEIFGWRRPEPRRRRQQRAIAPEDFFADMAPGDFVVHVEYGIGQFQGLEKRIVGGSEREFILVTYAGGDSLYVPIHHADRLGKYVGADDRPPVLSRLGTAEWVRVKERTQEAILQTARELLELYAIRETISGHAFCPDTPWQHELEASFPYVETDDQLRALAEVKADMERPRPMDRLICGDVGYGKTEVALRAAFKAVMDGKQVSMLVPTTVLAQQHFETFQRRLAPFPVNVEMLSRFRTRSEQAEIVGSVQTGSIDIVIGTHRLLGRDVVFKDLGLLIIDEEQRFGVTHKERLKEMRTEVDVLTLTATPIPRTLYMSLTGVRDISMIDTAPEERLPVVTHVGKRDEGLIRQAILRELDRGGQVYYVHNRVQTIYTETQRLCRLLPEAAIAIGHGQMPEAELEAVMHRFASGEVDVLVSTSIIESGLDIPNANTLIVDRADQFGLAQLYQLRGRVGRSANRAFAYFFHPPYHRLTPEARARLETIAEQTELGAGFNIAMRDLEIRGAGDILGTRQSGNITAVGFHLYTRMLAEAVKRLRSERESAVPIPPQSTQDLLSPLRKLVTIDLPLAAYIPTDYVPDMSLRLQLYRRLANLADERAISDMAAEMEDRFGPLPPAVNNLLYQLRVKVLALRADVEAVTSEEGQVSIRVHGLAHINRPALQQRLGHDVRVSRTAVWMPRIDHDGAWKQILLDVLRRLDAQ